jgi:hypothetical protein
MRGLGFVLLSAGCAAWASPSPADGFPAVVRRVGGGEVDWTTLTLHVRSASDLQVGAWKDRRMQEQDALDRLKPRVAAAARAVPVDPSTTMGDRLDGGAELALALEDGLGRWRIEETRYRADAGGVEMAARLDLREWVRPVLDAAGAPTPPAVLPPDGPTGLVVDARGTDFEPCVLPEISVQDGPPVLSGALVSAEALRRQTPAAYLGDPADPRGWARAGDTPLFLTVIDARGCRLLLPPGDAAGMNAAVPALVSAGRVLIVADPR